MQQFSEFRNAGAKSRLNIKDWCSWRVVWHNYFDLLSKQTYENPILVLDCRHYYYLSFLSP